MTSEPSYLGEIVEAEYAIGIHHHGPLERRVNLRTWPNHAPIQGPATQDPGAPSHHAAAELDRICHDG